jgi:DNA-binding NarL/FixJ family response regulator
MNVFIADDSALIRKRLAAMVSRLPGVNASGEATSTWQAVRRIGQMKPDVVILDLHMPGDGISIIEQIKGRVDPPLLIILTNFSNPQYRDRCIQHGADYFFDKSTEFSSVIEVIERISSNKIDRDGPSTGDKHD